MVIGHTYAYSHNITESVEIPLPASRGNIYDRLGRPLAINKSAYSIRMDASEVEINAENLHALVQVLENKGETIVDRLPFTMTEPFEFSFRGTGRTEARWKEDMGFTGDYMYLDAYESFQKLRRKFNIDENLPNSEARKILNLCNMLYLQRYRSWESITIAYDVRPETLSIVEEDTIRFAGFSAEVQSLRYYPEGKYFSHVVGFTGRITEQELLNFPNYEEDDIIGKNGIEGAYERLLRGRNGTAMAEITETKQIVNFLPIIRPATPGNNVYLTLDRDLQIAAYYILEEMLRDSLVNQMRGRGEIDNPITDKQFFSHFVRGVTLSIERIMETEDEDSPSMILRNFVLETLEEEPDLNSSEDRGKIRRAFSEAVEEGAISPFNMLMIMFEQEIISGGDEAREALASRRVSVLDVIVDRLETGEITPQMANLDPSTGSLIVTEVNTGNVLAAVNYPSYDTNEFVNRLNYEYWVRVNEDPTFPLLNRVFMERRAPGSTLKMVTAIAALERGSITTECRIYDNTVFTAAGRPHLRCWSQISHGSINVAEAIATSCNYFFCDILFRLGNTRAGNTLDSINIFGEYLSMFGLDAPSGAEIGEAASIIPSPESKMALLLAMNPDAPPYELEWRDGDTIQAAIGQGFNNFTVANMNKYIQTLATRGRRNGLSLVDSVRNVEGQVVEPPRVVLEAELYDICETTWDAVFEGMILVTESYIGTGTSTFRYFPIRVAGKTGTAQENPLRNDHSSFGGFAPFEDPQIAVYVCIPFGDSKAMPAIAAQVTMRVIGEFFGLDRVPEHPETINGLIR